MAQDSGHDQQQPAPRRGRARGWFGPIAAAASGAVATLVLGAPPVAAMAGAVAMGGGLALFGRPAAGGRDGGGGRTVAALNKAVFDSVADGIVGVDRDGRVTFLNPAAEMLCGWREKELIGRRHDKVFGLAVPVAGLDGAASRRSEINLKCRDGQVVPVESHASAIVEGGRVTGHVVVFHDIRERLRAEESRRLAAAVLEHSVQPIVVADLGGVIVAANPAFCHLSGHDAAAIIGRPVAALRSDHHQPAFHTAIRRALEQSGAWQGEVWNRRHDGSPYAVWLSITRIAALSGGGGALVAFYFDITERKRHEQSMAQAACHDALTGLPNRRGFEGRLAELAAAPLERGRRAALMLIDLDGFKAVNDNHGHEAGDAVLRAMAERMGKAIRSGDMAARLGGDEFVVVLGDAAEAAAARVAQTLMERLCQPVAFQGRDLSVSASIGIAFIDAGQSPAEALKGADQAMYEVKRNGKHGFCFHRQQEVAP